MTYRSDIDALKGIAILTVMLFHLGILKSGYLGVDVFFVINGFLIVPSLCRAISNNEFYLFPFLRKRTIRLLPMVSIAGAICLLIGFMGMLPDNFENIAETVIAGNLFSENILSALTTKNYWGIANDYKPLMHLWYLGILFEFYLLLPLVLIAIKKILSLFPKGEKAISSRKSEWLEVSVAVLLAVSFILFLFPVASESYKFYFIQYRSFELLLGGLAGILYVNHNSHNAYSSRYQHVVLFLLIAVLLSSLVYFTVSTIGTQIVPIGGGAEYKHSEQLIQSKSTLLLLTVILTTLLVYHDNSHVRFLNTSLLVYFGKRSYSLFIWHQMLLAFYRIFVSNVINVWVIAGYFLISIFLSELSYRFIEQKVRDSTKSIIVWGVFSFFVTLIAGGVYYRAGVVRDVPELSISKDNIHHGMHGEYCDRIYTYNRDFTSEYGKVKVLIEGVSFGRDFANCLLESSYSEDIELSYVFQWDEKYVERIKKADVIFTFMDRYKVPHYVLENIQNTTSLYGIGTKNYGQCNEIVYRKRNNKDYLNTTVSIDPSYVKLNNEWKTSWGDNYIDFIGMAELSPGKVRVFTPDGKFISQDCEHLTKQGAAWYGSIIDWEGILHIDKH